MQDSLMCHLLVLHKVSHCIWMKSWLYHQIVWGCLVKGTSHQKVWIWNQQHCWKYVFFLSAFLKATDFTWKLGRVCGWLYSIWHWVEQVGVKWIISKAAAVRVVCLMWLYYQQPNYNRTRTRTLHDLVKRWDKHYGHTKIIKSIDVGHDSTNHTGGQSLS